ncbi:MAG TPA: hypothetical protein VGG81_11350 [Edaphobacter sp.]|jgi:hypothetical protein
MRLLCSLLIVAGIAGCAANPVSAPVPAPTPKPTVTHAYQGTASVGDFLTITIDTSALTLDYTNVSNGDSGTIPYTVKANGSYTLNDPTGNMIAAYEVPGYALLIQAAKAGPDHNTPALITAVETGPVSIATMGNHSYNYMSFRTAAGGLEVGSVNIGSTTGQNSSYWPYGALNGGSRSPFNSGTLDFSLAQEAASGTYMYGPDGQGNDYIFGTAGGFFMVDTPNGSILGLQKAASKDFNPAVAGTYTAIYYQKTGARTGIGNIETGTPSLGQATIVVTPGGGITVTDAQGKLLSQATLTAVADTPYLYGSAGQLADPCDGLFTYRLATATTQQDVFVTFISNAVVFSTFGFDLPWNPGTDAYRYQYGVGLK